MELQESSTIKFKLDIEKQLTTVSYFFLERKYDIRTMANSSEVMTFFINRDMGMSEQYGLKVNLFLIHKMMQKALSEKVIKNSPIYKNAAFLNYDKTVLANSASLVPIQTDFKWKLRQDKINTEPELMFKETDHGNELMLVTPCFFKKKIAGWMVFWLDIDTLYQHLLGPKMQLFYVSPSSTIENSSLIKLTNQGDNKFPWKLFQEKINLLKDGELMLASDILPVAHPVLLMRMSAQQLPLFLVSYVPKKEIMGAIDKWQYFAGTGALCLLILGVVLIVQSNTKHMILKARFDESEKQQTLLTKQNVNLESEINRRKTAEQILRENEERYRKLFESSSDAILIASDNRITACNQKTTELLGIDHGKIVDKCLYEFSPLQQPDGRQSKEKYLEIINSAVESSQSFEWTLMTKNNQLIETEINMTALSLNSGRYIQVIIHDITERKRTENEKNQAQKKLSEQKKLALIGQVAGKMAHDFNNVLGIIMGHSELSLMDCEELQTRKTLNLIFEQTLRGKNLTKNLIVFAKSQEPKQEFLKISESIELVLNLLKMDLEGIALSIEKEDNMPDLLADPGMIEHALVNLIQNSIHALSQVKYPKITVRTYPCDNHICVEIKDNGCGIPKEYLGNIFEPSFTLKGIKDVTGSYLTGIKGTGYGMANVKKYVEQHKGSIFVESEINTGTRITIQFPVFGKDLTIQEKIIIQEEITHFNKHILLVEDEMALSDVQYRILTHAPCNHKVDIAKNGKIAMDLFDRNYYDFISLDYVLPGGPTGMDVYKHVRLSNKMIPILFVSGNIEFLEFIEKIKQEDDYTDHLSKPCQNMDYIKSINKLMNVHEN